MHMIYNNRLMRFKMANIAVLGAVYGDEGKGRIVHDFSPNYDWIVRFNGGANAGHTIYRDGKKYVHNLMPSFDWRSPKPKAYLGSGMVIDLERLHEEVVNLYNINPSYVKRVYVDTDAFVVLSSHKDEDRSQNSHIGSTNRGIGPAYKAKISRSGIRIADVMSNSVIKDMIDMGVTFTNVLSNYDNFKKDSILFEGAQGIMLDINHGTYPYVSCSDATVAGIYASGFASFKIDKVYGVAKCYSTKVGEGPFPTEIFDDDASLLREKGQEYGATTGRPRRVGWLDLPALKYACVKGGITNLIITKFDILNGMSEVPVCCQYDEPATCPGDFFKVSAKYINAPGWKDARETSSVEPLLKIIECHTERPVSFITFGVNAEDIVAM